MTYETWRCVGAAAAICATAACSARSERRTPSGEPRSTDAALAATLDRYHTRYDVYSGAFAAGNHFSERARLYSHPTNEAAAARAVPPMDESYRCKGRTDFCIHATFRPSPSTWGGWYFLNGALGVGSDGTTPGQLVGTDGQGVKPITNWGDIPEAGISLSGATKLTVWAAGAKGGERLRFIAFGVGRDRRDDQGRLLPDTLYPDSAPVMTTGEVTLTTSWREYSIDISRTDATYVLGGFGWVVDSDLNRGTDELSFYMADIAYDKPRLGEARFPLSYETINGGTDADTVLRNAAFTYDAAMALIAFVSAGDLARARLVADALVYAQANDRFYRDGRLRNAYQAGDLFLPPGWIANGRRWTVRMPGWYDATKGAWFEDRFQVSTHTGNVAWAMLALLHYYDAADRVLPAEERRKYLDATIRLARWVIDNTADRENGFTGGFDGWEDTSDYKRLLYKSTEHNVDLVAGFEWLARADNEPAWLVPAQSARAFVESMWDSREQKFWTGTALTEDSMPLVRDGKVQPNTSVVPVDAQAWAVLALGDRGRRFWPALDYAERHLCAPAPDCDGSSGFSFSQVDRRSVWYEGTAQMAVAYRLTRQFDKEARLVELLQRARLESGALPAASQDGLRTGFEVLPGIEWVYFKRAHVGATTWAALAARGVNPFVSSLPLPRQ